jgi:hypothetical protein
MSAKYRTMLKSLNEWARDNSYELDTLVSNQSMANSYGMETLYDEDLITQQVNDWLNKLTGLCSPVPIEDRPELVEQIIKSVRRQLLSH